MVASPTDESGAHVSDIRVDSGRVAEVVKLLRAPDDDEALSVTGVAADLLESLEAERARLEGQRALRLPDSLVERIVCEADRPIIGKDCRVVMVTDFEVSAIREACRRGVPTGEREG